MWEKKGINQGYDVKFCISGRKTYNVAQHTSQTQNSTECGWLFILEPGLGYYPSFSYKPDMAVQSDHALCH
jgi:hypothetical protein